MEMRLIEWVPLIFSMLEGVLNRGRHLKEGQCLLEDLPYPKQDIMICAIRNSMVEPVFAYLLK